MPLIFSISDKVYCLETGKVIVGTPADVRDNPLVIGVVPRHRRTRHPS